MPPRASRLCDFDCPQADFPPAETAGLCRTIAGVWCRRLGELVAKHTPCEWQLRMGRCPKRITGGRKPPRR